MGDTATGDQVPAGPAELAEHVEDANETSEASGMEVMYGRGESPVAVGTGEVETAREVGAEHLARLLYAPVNTWSRYVFHENDPHPHGAPRPNQSRG